MPHPWTSLPFVVWSTVIAAGIHAAELPAAGAPLADYVAQPDASYRWVKKSSGQLLSTTYTELILTSQTWRDIVWKHQLFVIKPFSMAPQTQHALLFISGGNWRDELETAGAGKRLGDEGRMYASLAELLKTPVAVLLHVPQQPIFDGKREDAIIAYTFEQYLQTRDPQWPLLLPMVKSAVRGMDAVQEFARQECSLDLKTFTVTGASKRGWTTWLTAAVDRRVTALAPMVIDMLNVAAQMEHQEAVWGAPSDKIHDYTERDLHRRFRSPAGQTLQQIIDPYQYRQQLKQAKLIILGTNDPYWPLDALNLYWPELTGAKYILYVPNNGHGLNDYGRVFGSLNALHRHMVDGQRLPQLTWQFEEQDGQLQLHVHSEPAAERVVAWIAEAPTQDFREARWKSVPTQREGVDDVFALPVPERGFAAVFGEAEYRSGDAPSFFSTNVRIVTRKD